MLCCQAANSLRSFLDTCFEIDETVKTRFTQEMAKKEPKKGAKKGAKQVPDKSQQDDAVGIELGPEDGQLLVDDDIALPMSQFMKVYQWFCYQNSMEAQLDRVLVGDHPLPAFVVAH